MLTNLMKYLILDVSLLTARYIFCIVQDRSFASALKASRKGYTLHVVSRTRNNV